MKSIFRSTITGAIAVFMAAVVLVAGLFISSAQAASASCHIRHHKHVVLCSNDTNDTYDMRVRVRLENGKRPRFDFTLDPAETWRKRFRPRVVGLSTHRDLVVTAPPTVPGTQQFNDGRLAVYVNSFFNGANDQTDLYFVNQTASTISYSCTWTNVASWGTSPGTYSDADLPGYEYDSFGLGGVSSISDLTCTSS
jgi:hypothetical protein